LQTLVDMLAVAPTYLRLALGVPPFRVDYGHLSGGQTLATPAVALGLGLLVALVVAGFWAWRSARLRPVGFGLLWAGAFLLPASNLVPMMQYMAERFLYTSLAGLVLAGAGIAALAPRQRLARACAALLVVAWAALAWQRSWIWRDEYTLFVTHYQRGLRSPRVDHNAEAALFHLPGIERVTEVDPDTGRLEVRRAPDAEAQTEALRDFEHALTILPENVALLSGYAMTLGNAGRMPEAIATFERVVALKPDNGFYWQNLAGALLFSGELQRARAAAQRAAELLPESAAVRELLRELEKRGG
jgi:tetratricopeptide (TPR) repeat protein